MSALATVTDSSFGPFLNEKTTVGTYWKEKSTERSLTNSKETIGPNFTPKFHNKPPSVCKGVVIIVPVAGLTKRG